MTRGKTVAAGFSILRWDETPLIDDGQVRMHSTHVEKQFTGELDGSSVADMIMLYVDGRPAAYCGFERVSARLGDRSGSSCFTTTREQVSKVG